VEHARSHHLSSIFSRKTDFSFLNDMAHTFVASSTEQIAEKRFKGTLPRSDKRFKFQTTNNKNNTRLFQTTKATRGCCLLQHASVESMTTTTITTTNTWCLLLE
jgi:hypothetical protein